MLSRLLVAFGVFLVLEVRNAEGFAYAPNFITKIIEEQTGIEPQGLRPVESADAASETTATVGDTKIKTRFPPEPNGYLHLGHAKAVSFNFAVSRMFSGSCNMRLDDTNPTKEDKEYVDSILDDVKWIQSGLYEGEKPWENDVRKTSDYFDLIYDCAVALIKSGDAYVDSLSAEEMREYRGTLTEPGKDSPFRQRTVEENLELFEGMRAGNFGEGEHVLRAKIDMASPNINMRDPALYRIKHESHQETGDIWCIYPMYDFSHPIADSIEDVTHSLCTLEFEDHRPFYDWTLEHLLPTGLIQSRPQQIEFSRLNVKNTVLSKRKLIQLVQDGHVSGWDDPRMPTLSGLRRRGIPPSALRLFCERVGISKADSNIDYSVLEDCVREIMDADCPRAFCVLDPLKVTITNWVEDTEDFVADRHPKISSMGSRTIPFGKTIFIERSDFFDQEGPEGQATGGNPPKGFKRLLPRSQVRLRYAYVIECNKIVRDPSTNEPVELICTYLKETRAGFTPEGMPRVKGIIHWVGADSAVECTVNQYDRLFSTEEPGSSTGNFLDDINKASLQVFTGALVEPSVAVDVDALFEIHDDKRLLCSLSYQFERSGYFAVDKSTTGTDNLVLNRVVTLRDTWGGDADASSKSQTGQPRTRGQAKSQSSSTESVEDIRRISLRAATILSCEQHPDADGLIVCKVDCGDDGTGDQAEPRTVVAGLAGKVDFDEIAGSRVVVVTNLKPAKMRGIESTAMLLAASNDSEVELLQVPSSVPNGELLSFEGKDPSEPDQMMKSKGALKAWERAKSGLQASNEGEACYVQGGTSFRLLSSDGPIVTKSLKGVAIQ